MTMRMRTQSGFKAIRYAMALMAMATFALPCAASPAAQNLILASQAVPKRAVNPPPRMSTAIPAREAPPVVTFPGTAPGHSGYIHYFVITDTDGETETQVGIEMSDDRIAWSVPNMGVAISPFIRSGQITANGKSFEVQHLYGIRPLLDEASLRVLQRDLERRVAWWVDQKTPYCDEELPPNRLCVSCLGFVLRVLYPGTSPSFPAMPTDFRTVRKNMYTTEDLLMYLAGVRADAPREARLKRIAELKVPDNMREELVRIATLDSASTSAPQASEAPRAAVTKPRSAARSVVKRPQARRGS